jgi:PadR family transcriptional regulator PadR
VSESLLVQLRKGVLDMCVLALLARRDGYAYDIASRLAQDIGMGEGTIYPLMRRMQTDGLVKTYLEGHRANTTSSPKRAMPRSPHKRPSGTASSPTWRK